MVEVEMKPDTEHPERVIFDESEGGISHFNRRVKLRSHTWRPPTDMLETEDSIIVRVEIAGMKNADFSVILDEPKLIIRGERPDHSERRAFHQMEIRFGEFSTEVELHWTVETKAIEAEYKDGFLWVTLPKTKPYSVEIES
jgi:HSP20 family molecular chaperone IbpA